MKKVLSLFLLLVGLSLPAFSQELAVKSNLLYDATTTINLGAEIGLAEKWTLDISGNYNPWRFGSEEPMMRIKHWMVQPELRYWLCEKFNGSFFGLHLHYADFNVGGIDFLSENMKNNRYQGFLYGAGVGFGHQWILSNRWSFEAEIGAGWARMHYDKFPCAECGTILKSDVKDYFGVTKVALSFIYFIK